jgi:hypothetical protein
MGYRNPSYDEDDDTVSQFEWDGEHQRWLYRRNEGAAPVAVTDEEKEKNESIQRKRHFLLLAVFVAIYIAITSWVEAAFEDSHPEIADAATPISMIAAFIVLYAGSSLIDWIATRRFRDRPPVDPALARKDVGRFNVTQANWHELVWPFAIVIVIVWAFWPPDSLKDWIYAGLLALFALVTLFGAFFKRETTSL